MINDLTWLLNWDNYIRKKNGWNQVEIWYRYGTGKLALTLLRNNFTKFKAARKRVEGYDLIKK